MGGLFRPKISRFVKDGKRCKSDTPGAERIATEGKVWWGTWIDHATGKECRKALHRSKPEAARLLAEIEMLNTRSRLGLPDPAPPASRAKLVDLVQAYVEHLQAKGDVPEHYKRQGQRIRKMLELLTWVYPNEISKRGVLEAAGALRAGKEIDLPECQDFFTTKEVADLLKIQSASVRRLCKRLSLPEGEKRGHTYLHDRIVVAGLVADRAQGVGVSTSNGYLIALKAFTSWLDEFDYLTFDPLRKLKLLNAEVDRRRERRSLAPELFEKFVAGTAAGATFRGLSGDDRLVIYTVAAHTGCRIHELGAALPSSFHLDGDRPSIEVVAKINKSKKTIKQALRPDLAEMLRVYLAGRPADQPVWPGLWWKDGAEMVRLDLVAAGIPFELHGKIFDFHALRGQFATMLAASDVHPRIAQALLRHSTIALTMKHYTDIDGLDVRGALDSLPPLPRRQPKLSAE